MKAWKWTLHADFQITRRKKYHLLVDEKEVLLHSTPHLVTTLEYLLDAGHDAVRVLYDGQAYQIRIKRLPATPESPLGDETPT